MQFLTVSVLALAGFSAAQSYSEIGLVCTNLYNTMNPDVKRDPNGWWVTEPSMCNDAGGKLYVNDIICCPKSDASEDYVPFGNACNKFGGSVHWPQNYFGTKFEIVPEGWKCPK